MTNKKNGFLAFIFSFLPGAAEMYMGFMKQGLSLMIIFFASIALTSWFRISPLLFIVPVIWFYSFFHAHNLRSLPMEVFFTVEDRYLFSFSADQPKASVFVRKYRKLFAMLLILIGLDILWNNFTELLASIIPDIYYNYFSSAFSTLTRMIPQVFVAAAIIYAGFYLIKGKQVELREQEFSSPYTPVHPKAPATPQTPVTPQDFPMAEIIPADFGTTKESDEE